MATERHPTATTLPSFPDDHTVAGSAHLINLRYLADEATCVKSLSAIAAQSTIVGRNIHKTAASLVAHVRVLNAEQSGLDAFLQKYDLSSQEGIMLMCIAEALLRIPDKDTADRLIADKLSMADWSTHLGTSESLFVNASTWGLMLTGRMLSLDDQTRSNPSSMLRKLVSRAGEPVVRSAMRSAMRIMGHQFVMGRTIGDALKRARKERHPGWLRLSRRRGQDRGGGICARGQYRSDDGGRGG